MEGRGREWKRKGFFVFGTAYRQALGFPEPFIQ
jgi:hypothetical protein